MNMVANYSHSNASNTSTTSGSSDSNITAPVNNNNDRYYVNYDQSRNANRIAGSDNGNHSVNNKLYFSNSFRIQHHKASDGSEFNN